MCHGEKQMLGISRNNKVREKDKYIADEHQKNNHTSPSLIRAINSHAYPSPLGACQFWMSNLAIPQQQLQKRQVLQINPNLLEIYSFPFFFTGNKYKTKDQFKLYCGKVKIISQNQYCKKHWAVHREAMSQRLFYSLNDLTM